MSIPTTKYPGRVVSTENGEKVIVYGCGQTVCTDKVFQGRLIDVDDTRGMKIFGVASECMNLDTIYNDIHKVATDCNPPWGISSLLEVVFAISGNSNCWLTPCPRIVLTWDGVKWAGTLDLLSGSIALELNCTLGSYSMTLTSACFSPAQTVDVLASCTFPFIAGGGTIVTLDPSCCSGIVTSSTEITFMIFGVTPNRYLARLVDVVGGEKIFMTAVCCPSRSGCLTGDDCCGCEVSPLQWSFSVAGVTAAAAGSCCDGFNGHWTLTYVGNPAAPCLWDVEDNSGVCTPGPPYSLRCDQANGVWRLTTSTPTGGAAKWELDVASWECLGPNTLNLVDAASACTGWPTSITITAV